MYSARQRKPCCSQRMSSVNVTHPGSTHQSLPTSSSFSPIWSFIVVVLGFVIAWWANCFIGYFRAWRYRRLGHQVLNGLLRRIRRAPNTRIARDFAVRILRLVQENLEAPWNQANQWVRDTLQLRRDMDGASNVPPDEVFTENPSGIRAHLGSFAILVTLLRSSLIDTLGGAQGENSQSAPINNTSREHTGEQRSSENSGSTSRTPTLEFTWVKQKLLFGELCRCIESYASYRFMKNEDSDVQWSKEFIEELESKPLSKYSEWQLDNSWRFTLCVKDEESKVLRAVRNLDSSFWDIEYPSIAVNRFSVRSDSCGSFIVVIDDFILIYDEMLYDEDSTISFQVPGSPFVTKNYEEVVQNTLLFDSLIGEELPIQQVHFLVRRFVQLTGATWAYSCLASLERTRHKASALRWYPKKLFSNIRIELSPTLFNCLSGVDKISRFDNEDDSLHNVVVEVFGDVIGFRKDRCDVEQPTSLISYPVLLPEAALISCEDVIPSQNDFAIGGDEHTETYGESSITSASRGVTSLPEKIPAVASPAAASTSIAASSQPACFAEQAADDRLAFEQVWPMMLALSSFTEENGTKHPVFNLAYIPDNSLFQALMKKKYSVDDFGILKADFIKLGYGEQLSDCIQHVVITDFSWSSGKTVTLVEAQFALFRVWRKFKSSEMIALKLGKKRYIRRREKFLVLSNSKLYFAQSEANISRQTLFSTVEAQHVTLDDTPVSTLKDAVETLSGLSVTVPYWRKVRPLLGAIAFICFFLEGHVHPRGRFGNFSLDQVPNDEDPSMVFNLPVPCGIACSTLVQKLLNKRMNILVEGAAWTLYHKYRYPVIFGAHVNDLDLITEICGPYPETPNPTPLRCPPPAPYLGPVNDDSDVPFLGLPDSRMV